MIEKHEFNFNYFSYKKTLYSSKILKKLIEFEDIPIRSIYFLEAISNLHVTDLFIIDTIQMLWKTLSILKTVIVSIPIRDISFDNKFNDVFELLGL